MKLKNKVLLSFLSIAMLFALFAFVDVLAGYANCIVEKRIEKGGEDSEVMMLECALASNESLDGCYIISALDGSFVAEKNGIVREASTLQELISEIEEDGAEIFFDGVESYGNLNFTRNVILSGRLTLPVGNLGVSSERLIIDELNINMESGGIFVRSGNVEMRSGAVSSSASSAFILNYSASSSLTVLGGEISAATTDGAISSSMGSVIISGGKISNSYGYAVKNKSTLILSGTPQISGFEFDIRTEAPINLSYAKECFKGNVKVIYDEVFEKGTITPVFRDSEIDSVSNITLYDSIGEEVELTFFESSDYVLEKDFLAVYLPHTVKFYSEGVLYDTVSFLKNEAIVAPAPPTKDGYRFDSWFTDSSLNNVYTFGSTESADFSLFAGFALMPPEFVLNSKSFIFDRKQYALSFEKLTHPLAVDGSFSFEWFKDSEAISYSSESIPLSQVSDSGAYKCKLTFSYNGDFVTVMTPEVTVLIGKATVIKPNIESYEYTGNPIIPSIAESELYTYSVSPSVNVGVYPVTFTLTDSVNYRWQDSDTRYTSSSYEITKAENKFLSEPIVIDSFSGNAPTVLSSVKFGELKILYSEDGAAFTEEMPTLAGEYFLKLHVPDCENYFLLESEIIPFKILPELPVGIKLDKAPDKTDYVAFEELILDGAEFSVTYNSGRVEKADNTSLSVKYKSGSCFLAEDSCAIVFFENVSVPVTVNVSLAEYDIGQIVFDSLNTVYNGKRQTLSVSGEVIGSDGIPLVLKVTGGGIDAGEYSVTLSFMSDSLNYKLPAPIQKKLVILPLEISVEFKNLEFVYDGRPKVPTATAHGAEGLILPLSVVGVATDAGLYFAKAELSDKNYVLKNAEAEFEILKADLDFSEVSWSGESFVYTGSTHSVTVSGLPSTVTFVGYTDSSFINAGEYTATASIIYDTKNYNTPEPITHGWSILPADYDFSDCIFLDSEYTFDGDIHYPALLGSIPSGADGSRPEYTYSQGVTHVSEGWVNITVSFTTDSKNYKTPPIITASVKINPKPVNVFWENLNFIYDGVSHIPTATVSECNITVTGGATDAGTYTAKAESTDSDYMINNSEVVFIIARAANFWKMTPTVGVQFEGRLPAPHAEAHCGEAQYAYYADAALAEPISAPSKAGKYYVVAYVPESRNYNYLSYAPIEFSIIEVVPISISVDITPSSLVAMHSFGEEDITAYLVNNDGSKTALTLGDLSVKYENGEKLYAKDSSISFSFGGFKVTYNISVEKAVYDMSGAYWDKTEVIYSGVETISSLIGLPLGVSVEKYILNSGINVGEYKLSATLLYDAENYLPPVAPMGKLTVKPCEVKLPEISDVTYDGSLKTFIIPEDALYTTDFEGAVHAGVYEVIFTLKDSKNYSFAGNPRVRFEILKSPITAEISKDCKGYTLVSGIVYGDDELSPEYFTEDGLVYMRISNPDYDLTVIPAKERRDNLWLIFLIVLLVILILLAAFIVYRRWGILFFAFSGIKERLIHKGYVNKEKYISESISAKDSVEPPLETLLAVDEAHANSLISDSLAKNLVTDADATVETEGRKKVIINIDTISDNFLPNDTVDINKLKEKKLIQKDAGKLKVLARGVIDKPLTVIANSFSLSAVKMIALTGGSAKKAHTSKRKTDAERKTAG